MLTKKLTNILSPWSFVSFASFVSFVRLRASEASPYAQPDVVPQLPHL